MKTAEEWGDIIANLADDSFCFDQLGAHREQIPLENVAHVIAKQLDRLEMEQNRE